MMPDRRQGTTQYLLKLSRRLTAGWCEDKQGKRFGLFTQVMHINECSSMRRHVRQHVLTCKGGRYKHNHSQQDKIEDCGQLLRTLILMERWIALSPYMAVHRLHHK